jgi:hypothetical protein
MQESANNTALVIGGSEMVLNKNVEEWLAVVACELIMAVTVKSTIFWGVTSCSLVKVDGLAFRTGDKPSKYSVRNKKRAHIVFGWTVFCLAYSPIMKMIATNFFETSMIFKRTWHRLLKSALHESRLVLTVALCTY